MKPTALLVPLTLALMTGCANTLPAPASAPEFDAGAMDALLSGAVERGEVIGVSALVFDEGAEVYNGAFGLRDREAGLPVTEDTVWRIYSMTKPMTSAVIMDLEEEGLLSLSDPVSKFIPSFADVRIARPGADGSVERVAPRRAITVEDLLLHTAGLGYGIFGDMTPIEAEYARAQLFRSGESLADKVDRIAALPLNGEPGEQWFYSISIDVLGRIIEVVTQQSLADAMQARLFGPLGMDETAFVLKDGQEARFAQLYALTPEGEYVLAPGMAGVGFREDPGFQSGGGGLVSTQDDVARFAQMMLNGGTLDGARILEAETVKRMMSDHLDGRPSVLPWLGGDTGAGFGYGGSVQLTATPEQQAESGRYPGQWGWGGAARTNMFIDPANDSFGIIMLQFFSAEDPPIHNDFQAEVLRQTRDLPLAESAAP